MASLSSTLAEIVLSYVGPEPERVRTAIATLAQDDIERMRHFLRCAQTDYRDVLMWAEQDAEAAAQRRALGSMTVNERLSHLGLIAAWDAAIAKHDVEAARALLLQCAVSETDTVQIVEATLGRA